MSFTNIGILSFMSFTRMLNFKCEESAFGYPRSFTVNVVFNQTVSPFKYFGDNIFSRSIVFKVLTKAEKLICYFIL